MKISKNKYMLCLSLSSMLGFGQTVNEGLFSILPTTDVSTVFSFVNEKGATVQNDGGFYFYAHFTNEGLYTFDGNKKTSYAVFQPYDGSAATQNLQGSAPSGFYDVLFNNPTTVRAFELQNDMSISGTANFTDGIVQIDSLSGAMLFEHGAKAINTSDKSHADGEVEKVGRDAFTYPIGDEGMYRFAHISAPAAIKDAFLGKYYFKNSNAAQPHANKVDELELIDNKEYWTIEKMVGKSDVILTLSWDTRTTPPELLDDIENTLRIARWDSKQNRWVDQGGIVDLGNKTVTSPTEVDGYGVFTLAKIKAKATVGDVVIYNAVSPNGDGENDYFIIDNIERYPNNTVQIYNRWGVKVFDTSNYNSNDNVFKGYSDGRVTVKKNDKLPTGTYYYIVNYEYTDKDGTRMIKKSGYLHLENN
ncbi:gliding motility-associated C-terminal domain-containing protein [Flavobacterium sp. HSC-61S13]|uniref:gliding motility-associated C-terminal domain-containing protein n=1 Tax=Flavobacterium sp. HSC-61S13 TaxID=2910963 RepID=UPI0020A144C5|nr:gliding motility-associated C-terminal domain-containing protein [Flavobacterium sp. HSC-61S13]MCP1997471.1 gliding motility-associated-like protein [Flavobacterium sp. HSC-61S13]